MSANGKSAYVTSYSSSTVSQFTVAANGTLSPKTPATVATDTSPIGVALSPDGKSGYVANTGDNTVAHKTPATVASASGPLVVVVSADGKSAYVDNIGNINAGMVSQYTVAGDGTLSPKTPATVANAVKASVRREPCLCCVRM